MLVMYKIGEVVTGEVVNITEYGAFIKLANDYTGLIHISEISNDFVHSIEHYVRAGDEVKAKILEIDNKRKQLKLSFKELDYKVKPIYRNQIVDTEHGFESLAKQLPLWINKKHKKTE